MSKPQRTEFQELNVFFRTVMVLVCVVVVMFLAVLGIAGVWAINWMLENMP